jgi:hypothetical protein
VGLRPVAQHALHMGRSGAQGVQSGGEVGEAHGSSGQAGCGRGVIVGDVWFSEQSLSTVHSIVDRAAYVDIRLWRED